MSKIDFKTLNQERAKFASKKIQAVKDGKLTFKNKKGQEKRADKKKFATYAKRLPALIITNGLLPTLAFLASKDDSRAVYETLVGWLQKEEFICSKDKYDAIEEVANISALDLRAITTEALAFADWLKRLSEAYLSDEEGDGQES